MEPRRSRLRAYRSFHAPRWCANEIGRLWLLPYRHVSLPEALDTWAPVFLVLTTISVVYGALSACVQTDLKYINAYSSVSHCGMVLFALLMMTQTAITGAVLQMLSHGLMTALFFAVIGMIYHRAGTRDVRYLGGLMKIVPFLSVGYVVAGLANLGLPGFSGFVAEMTIFVGSFQNADLFHRVCTIALVPLSWLRPFTSCAWWVRYFIRRCPIKILRVA